MNCMAKKMGRPKGDQSRKKETTSIRLSPDMRAALEVLRLKNDSDLVEEIRIAIRMRLESLGLWPFKPKE